MRAAFSVPWFLVFSIAACVPLRLSASEPDWASLTLRDVEAIHADIEANHPGPHNILDPTFNQQEAIAYQRAMAWVEKVSDYSGYFWTLRGYLASFNDDHVNISPTKKAPVLPSRWPGFLTAFDGHGQQVVVTRLDNAPVPLGAALISCDGVPAQILADRNVAAFTTTWSLESSRREVGWRLFTDMDNPFIQRPRRCFFLVDHHSQTVQLRWRRISASEMQKYEFVARQHHVESIGLRVFPDGMRWLSLSGFDGAPGSAEAQALTRAITALKQNRDIILSSSRFVLDLRGNSGGSSDWSRQIAEIIWGRKAVEAVPVTKEIDWRASPGNVDMVSKEWRQLQLSPDTSQDMKTFVSRVVSGMRKALQSGSVYWAESDESQEGKSPSRFFPLVHPTIFLVTDGSCASACLDAVDLWRALGAVQVGRETSADTLYMDERTDLLPSGLIMLRLPMKVYRGRLRGSNIPWEPVYHYDGDMRDTRTIASWIAHLPLSAEARKRP
ncbi:hypothetical protein GS501_09700 [Saccharibacter sp. 17.LH.SD]|uniref:hypothetical protein n=1 Tax=Saccharibacter sp. 17.LH.SD TaxID=2689393 RepID=UPI001369AB42|nr:hypothetical protein [Saccharibacter sp. 17.LH.SD]MXV45303.1 hypothetical protein [Saccharibacter sp. 17.LH.SD]